MSENKSTKPDCKHDWEMLTEKLCPTLFKEKWQCSKCGETRHIDAITTRNDGTLIAKEEMLNKDWSKEYDCFDYGCGQCKVCQYLSFLEWAEGCAPAGSTIQRDEEMEQYLKNKTITP